jgi:hypothetical protein
VNRLGGAGVQHAEQFGRAQIKSLYASRGKGRKEFMSPSKSPIRSRVARNKVWASLTRPFLVPDRPGSN